jgi:mRNA interferase RelE/StbE
LTYEIVWADEALAAAQSFMGDDPAGLSAVFDAVDELAVDPRPPTASRWGGSEVLRLRVGRYRVLYEVEDQIVTISVVHLGRSG